MTILVTANPATEEIKQSLLDKMSFAEDFTIISAKENIIEIVFKLENSAVPVPSFDVGFYLDIDVNEQKILVYGHKKTHGERAVLMQAVVPALNDYTIEYITEQL